MKPCLLALTVLAATAAAQSPRIEAGIQVGAIDERETFDEKPALAGGRVTVRLHRFLSAEAEIDRFPIGGAYSAYPGTEFLFGVRVGHRLGPMGLFATVRPGFIRYPNETIYSQKIGTRPVVNLGNGTRHQFQGTAGFGVWF